MNHRKWKDLEWNRMYIRSMVSEHDALYEDWQQSSLEAERLAKVNGDLCDKIGELEAAAIMYGSNFYADSIGGYQIFGSMENVNAVKKIFSDLRDTNRETLDENNRLDRELDEARQALKPPIRVPFSDEVIHRMARAACLENEDITDWNRANKGNWYAAIRAALAESDCTAERDSLKARVAELEAEARANIEWQETMVLDLKNKDAELDAVTAEHLKCLEGFKDMRDRLCAANEQLEAVTAERDENAVELSRLQSVALVPDEAGEQLAALRQPVEARPVKVRFDVTAEDVEVAFADGSEEDSWQSVMNYLAAHAVIDVPKGVPSVEELMDIGDSAYDNEKCHPDCDIARAAAIRDAVLAGVGQTPHATHEPIDAEVEALARVLDDAYGHWDKDWESTHEEAKNGRRAQARAAFANIGRVPVGFELDVTWDEVRRNYEVLAERKTEVHEDHADQIDWLRSRIRPVYECKECAKKEAELRRHNDKWTGFIQRCQADAENARTAMEGE